MPRSQPLRPHDPRRPRRVSSWVQGIVLGALAWSPVPILGPAPARAESTDPAAPSQAPFGFRALEVFKASAQSHSLQTCDVNGDGRRDLALANNAEGTIWLLIQRSPEEIATARDTAAPLEINETGSDLRFRTEKFFTEAAVSSLCVADLNGDGKEDLAYYADPPALHVISQATTWGAERTEFAIRDGSPSSYALRSADLDRDGSMDLVLLGRQKTYIFRQNPERKGRKDALDQPVVLRNAFPSPSGLEILDANGDGRPDLVTLFPSRRESVLLRMATPTGFGPEIVPKLRPIQSWNVVPLRLRGEESARATILTLDANNRRLALHRLKTKPTNGDPGSPRLIAQDTETGGQRFRLIDDVDGNQRSDFAVAYSETAQIDVVFQSETGVLGERASFPTLSGVNGIAAGDVGSTPGREVVVSSRKEKALGVSAWKGGRLEFPRMIRLPDEIASQFQPIQIAVAPLARGGRDAIFVISEADGSKFWLRILELEDDVARVVAETEIDSKGTAPSALRVFDLEGDGRTEALVFVPYGEPRVFATTEIAAVGEMPARTTIAEISGRADFGRGLLRDVDPSNFTTATGVSPPGETLLIVSKSYIRLVRMDADRRLEVFDQISSGRAGLEYATATAIDLDADGQKEIVALDRATNAVEVLRKAENGTYELSRTVEVPALDVTAIGPHDLDHDGREDIVLFGKQADAVLFNRTEDETLEEVLTYAEEDKDLGTLEDVGVGDFNADGWLDIAISTSSRYNFLFLASQIGEAAADGRAPPKLERRLAFPIFEEKSYMRRTSNLGPRAMLTTDLDGDGLDDLVLLIHDRVLAYLQDAPLATAAEASPETEKVE
jgi:hypothetical protein